VLLPMYFMIGVWGGDNRQYASIKFFLFTLFGSALMILSFLALYFKGGQTFSIPELIRSRRTTSATPPRCGSSPGLFMGFAIKVPIVPVPHPGCPDAHTQAPTAGLGDPGRDPPEARHVRASSRSRCRCSPTRPTAGRRGSACSP
jgi:NADH-quinone oxidoreductase subunit M